VDDARLAAEAGADAIGLNFYHASPRRVSEAMAQGIVDAVAGLAACVGVFVNHAAADVVAISRRLALDWIQLHGDESPELIAELGASRVIRALPCGPAGRPQVEDYLAKCRELRAVPAALLADAAAGTTYGGTGRTADWNELAPPHDWLQGIPLILAGGLNPENVAAAIRTVKPVGVDTASGVEASPGRKDPRRVKQFIQLARDAFDTL
jgi:phosphoribosylanthranilate isomerase